MKECCKTNLRIDYWRRRNDILTKCKHYPWLIHHTALKLMKIERVRDSLRPYDGNSIGVLLVFFFTHLSLSIFCLRWAGLKNNRRTMYMPGVRNPLIKRLTERARVTRGDVKQNGLRYFSEHRLMYEWKRFFFFYFSLLSRVRWCSVIWSLMRVWRSTQKIERHRVTTDSEYSRWFSDATPSHSSW
jgi:hypothetical protein